MTGSEEMEMFDPEFDILAGTVRLTMHPVNTRAHPMGEIGFQHHNPLSDMSFHCWNHSWHSVDRIEVHVDTQQQLSGVPNDERI